MPEIATETPTPAPARQLPIAKIAVAIAVLAGLVVLGRAAGGGAPGALAGIAVGEAVAALLFLVLMRRGAWLTHRI